MAFKAIGTLSPFGGPVLRRAIITNSLQVTELQSFKLTSGFAAAGTTGALVFGHVTGVSTDGGVGVGSTGAAGAAFGSYVGVYTAASNNQTVGLVRVECDISKETLYSASLNATIGTTTGSNLMGYKINLADANQLSESSTTTTTLQYNTWGVDPANSANAVVNIYESQVSGV